MHKPPSSPASHRPASARDNRVRIIGGRWRGRKLSFPDVPGLRPTGDRIRETLFNWLQPVLPGAHCLDLFAGSGALGFEALSRGATSCVLLERNPQALRCLRDASQLLGATQQAQIVDCDALAWLRTASARFDIVFIDPPFADTQLAPASITSLLQAQHMLGDDARIYVEQPTGQVAAPPAGFTLHRQQRAGQVDYAIWRREPE